MIVFYQGGEPELFEGATLGFEVSDQLRESVSFRFIEWIVE